MVGERTDLLRNTITEWRGRSQFTENKPVVRLEKMLDISLQNKGRKPKDGHIKMRETFARLYQKLSKYQGVQNKIHQSL